MSGRHTPGPWSIIHFGGMQIGHKPSGEAVCTMWGSDTDPGDPKLANARLIAAAPELLQALKEQVAECFCEDCEMCARHEAVIAKATGAA